MNITEKDFGKVCCVKIPYYKQINNIERKIDPNRGLHIGILVGYPMIATACDEHAEYHCNFFSLRTSKTIIIKRKYIIAMGEKIKVSHVFDLLTVSPE